MRYELPHVLTAPVYKTTPAMGAFLVKTHLYIHSDIRYASLQESFNLNFVSYHVNKNLCYWFSIFIFSQRIYIRYTIPRIQCYTVQK